MALTVIEYLKQKGAHLIPSSGGFKCKCPLPDHNDKDPSLSVYVRGAEQTWWCFGCSRGFDVWNLVRYMEGCSFQRAIEIVGEAPPNREMRVRHSDPLDVALPPKIIKLLLAAGVRSELMEGEISFDEADTRYRGLLEGVDIGTEED